MATRAGLFEEQGQVSAAVSAPAGPLWFVRCCDCLAVVAVPDGEMPRRIVRDGYPVCGACGGRVESMGQVHRDRLVVVSERSVCDDRCTCARGPSCDCKCGGKHHGTKLTVKVRRDLGPEPVVMVQATGVLLRIADELRQARERAFAAVDALPGARFADAAMGGWLPPEKFQAVRRWRELRADVVAALRGKIHRVRLAKLAALEMQAKRAGVGP